MYKSIDYEFWFIYKKQNGGIYLLKKGINWNILFNFLIIILIANQWVPTNTWKNSGERNNLISWTSFSESEPGNTDNSQSSPESTDQPDPTKPEDSVTRPRTDTSCTELESEEVEERDQFQRVSLLESQLQSVSTNWSQPETSEPRPSSESETDSPLLESSTVIGSPKTVPTSTTKSSWSTHPTTESETTPESTGSATHNTREEKQEDSPQPVRPTEVSESRDISTPRPDPPEEPTTREEIWSESRVIDRTDI